VPLLIKSSPGDAVSILYLCFFLTQDKVPENRTLENLGAKLGNITKLSGVFSQDRVGDIAGK